MRTLKRPILVAAIAATITPLAARADDTYIGLNTTWSNPAAWSDNAPPTATDNVFITPTLTPTDTNTLTLDTAAAIANLTLGSAVGTTILNLAGNSLTANVTTITSAAELTGPGTLSTILNNAGTILAAGNTSITLGNSTNTGAFIASPGAQLSLSGATLQDTAGSFFANGNATANATIQISLFALNGGHFSTNAQGQIRLSQTTLSNATISGNFVSLTGDHIQDSTFNSDANITAPVGDMLPLRGNITNNTNITIAGQLYLAGNVTLNGTGSINFASAIDAPDGTTVTIGPSQTITGTGNFWLTHNLGTIQNNTANVSLVLNPAFISVPTPSSNTTNSGSISATNGAIVALVSGDGPYPLILDNTNGTISATGSSPTFHKPSAIYISNMTVSGGLLSTDAAGQINLQPNVALSNLSVNGNLVASANTTLTNITFAGALSLATNTTVTLVGSLTNNANISLASNQTFLLPANLTLAGNGDISMTGGSIAAAPLSNATLTIASTQSISGYGTLPNLVNHGSINASSQILAIAQSVANGTLVNDGTITSTNGALQLPPSIDNTNGTILSNGGNISFPTASTLTGGTLQAISANLFSLTNLSVKNASLTGTFSTVGTSSALQDDTLFGFVKTPAITISSNITNNANWTLSSLRISNAATLTGTGTLVLTGGQINSSNNTNAILSIAPSASISGYGFINNIATAGVTLLNAGTINANAKPLSNSVLSSSPLSITLFLPSTNSGTLSATNNGTLQLTGASGATLDNTNGTLSANGGNISLANLSLTGGQLFSAPANTISLSNNLTLSGTISANGTLVGTANLTLTLAPGAALNLAHGALILQITDPSTLPAIQSEIAAGTLFTSAPSLSLALIDNSSLTTPFTTFAGQPVSPSSLLITPALPGDTNLDNAVDLSDLSTILNNFGQSTSNWTDGNFDHTPTINLTDLSDVLNNFGVTNPSPAIPVPTPEPATLLLAAPLLLRRTRKIRNREHICART